MASMQAVRARDGWLTRARHGAVVRQTTTLYSCSTPSSNTPALVCSTRRALTAYWPGRMSGVARDADRGIVTRLPSRCVVELMTDTDHVSGQRWDWEEYLHDSGADRGGPHVRTLHIPTD
jgi:hypothetical protein